MQWVRSHLREYPLLFVERAAPDIYHRLKIDADSEAVEADWTNLAQALRTFIPSGSSVLFDITHQGFEELLYLLPALQACHLNALGCIYVAPDNFNPICEDTLDVQDTLPIGQPRGYVALTTQETRANSRHIIFLGFDQGRAWEFVRKYDWDESHLHLVVGDPAFVAGGADKALESCQPWLDPFRKAYSEHLHSLNAQDPDAVGEFLHQQLAQVEWLDIVPLGPKPMILGILAFYFSLSEHDRARVRLLYDFPSQQKSRCSGVQSICFLSCSQFLAA